MKTEKAFHIVLVGRVQGVGFRYFVHQSALELNLKGWVKNKVDGSVEIEVNGNPDLLSIFIEKLKLGNGYSRVDRVFKSELPELHYYESFYIKY